MPSSGLEVVRIVNDPDSSLADLRRAVEHDPSLTTNILRLANSAYFGRAGEIGTLQDAVVRLGMRRILHLVIGSAVAPLAQPPIRGYDMPAGSLLRHSVATAVASEELAHRLNREPPDQCFTAGLLHDLGKILLGTYLEIDAAPIRALAYEQGVSFQDAEQRVLGLNHAEVGALLLEQWNLPAPIVGAVRWHHEPDAAPDEQSFATDLVHVANEIARMSGTADGADGFNYMPSAGAISRLGMTERIVEQVVSSVLSHLNELSDLFAQTAGVDRNGS
ncbi:MAG: HDOD domain-containing protein [Candidatus Hydrogenedentes bacterium]|nr:HDOD domain-containing protein [Candidatus Hydrogenedentota bacterium]